jgi:hypothetical protein
MRDQQSRQPSPNAEHTGRGSARGDLATSPPAGEPREPQAGIWRPLAGCCTSFLFMMAGGARGLLWAEARQRGGGPEGQVGGVGGMVFNNLLGVYGGCALGLALGVLVARWVFRTR